MSWDSINQHARKDHRPSVNQTPFPSLPSSPEYSHAIHIPLDEYQVLQHVLEQYLIVALVLVDGGHPGALRDALCWTGAAARLRGRGGGRPGSGGGALRCWNACRDGGGGSHEGCM